MPKLTAKQQKFVDAYSGNATEAAIAAGYNKNTARVMGSENLTKPDIISAIRARETKPKALRILNREERQNFWTEIVMSSDEQTKDRLKASELLGRSEADFTDKLQADMSLKIVRKEYKPSK